MKNTYFSEAFESRESHVDKRFDRLENQNARIEKRFDRLEHQHNRLQAKLEIILDSITGISDLPEE